MAHKVEDHLAQIYSPVVPLRSGGYLVINQTEALVAVDVNSGRATRERNIEATALKTNLEAAEEAARQLRLRDLAGLIVIDFIDMDEAKNNRAVEKKLKDCLKDDRARVQMGKISGFGLMEISRQRRRTGVLEGTTHVCPVCEGVGRVRSTKSSALAALRAVDVEALKGGGGEVTLKVPRAVGLYILNEKRAHLARIHQTHGLYVTIQVDDAMAHADHEIERTSEGQETTHALEAGALPAPAPEPEDDFEDVPDDEEEDEELEAEIEDEESEGGPPPRDDGERSGRRRRRRGRSRRGGEDRPEGEAPKPAETEEAAANGEEGQGRRRRRRGRRGGRRTREDGGDGFAWSRPRVPFGDDPFVWHDPATLDPALAASEAANDAAPKAEAAPQPAAEAETRQERRGRGLGRTARRERTGQKAAPPLAFKGQGRSARRAEGRRAQGRGSPARTRRRGTRA